MHARGDNGGLGARGGRDKVGGKGGEGWLAGGKLHGQRQGSLVARGERLDTMLD